jgi:cytochrome c-type biogenesis protein CcmH
MKILKLFFIIFFIFSFNHLGAKTDDMKIKITKNLRCLICQGQSVYDSDSEFANSMKVLVDKKLNEGFSEKQIYDFLKKNMENGFCMILNLIKIPIFCGYYQY